MCLLGSNGPASKRWKCALRILKGLLNRPPCRNWPNLLADVYLYWGEKLRSRFFFLLLFSPSFTGPGLVIGKCYQRQIGHTWLLKGSRDRHCDLVNDWT